MRDHPLSAKAVVKELGRLQSTHPTAPAFLQRAAVVAILSFVFFLAMLIVFYFRQQIGYFILSTAFLVVYIFTLIGWVFQRRNVVKVHEHGLRYRKLRATWDEIEAFTVNKEGLTIRKNKRENTLIPSSVVGFEQVVRAVKRGVGETS
jgi:hypothetical protein